MTNNDVNECRSDIALKIYDSIFAIIEELYNTSILLSITQENGYIMIVTIIENRIKELSDKIVNKCADYIFDINEKQTEEGTKISYKINI